MIIVVNSKINLKILSTFCNSVSTLLRAAFSAVFVYFNANCIVSPSEISSSVDTLSILSLRIMGIFNFIGIKKMVIL